MSCSCFLLCNGTLPLQIPEVRLNIISNLDCVNQGKLSIGTVKVGLVV